MKVRGNQAPPEEGYSIHDQPDKPGYAWVRFYENAVEVEEVIDWENGLDGEIGEVYKFWEYDEYSLIVPKTPNLAEEIEADYDNWLLTAKSCENLNGY